MKKLNKSLILACLSLMGSGIPTMATTISNDSVNDTKKTVQKVKKSNHEINTDRAKYFFDPGYAVFNLAHSVAMFNDKTEILDQKDKNTNLVAGISNVAATTSCLALRPASNTAGSNLLTGLAPTAVSFVGALATMPSQNKFDDKVSESDLEEKHMWDPAGASQLFGFCKFIVDIVNTVSRANRINQEEKNKN